MQPLHQLIVLFVSLTLLSLSHESSPGWSQLSPSYSFEQYLHHHNKHYAEPAEYVARKQLFEQRLRDILHHNAQPSTTWKKGVNHFTDRFEHERQQVLGLHKRQLYQLKAAASFSGSVSEAAPPVDLPTSVDWRDSGVVSPVKDQGQCGSCWSFAAAETVESYWALKTGNLAILSEEQILGCTVNPKECGGTGGCGGGTVEVAYSTIINVTRGLAAEWTYPYVSYWGNNLPCKFNKTTTPPAAFLASYTILPSNQYQPLLTAVASRGPIAISVDASAWFEYHSGVFNGCNQTHPDLDHAVQLVGYGTDDKLGDYWLVRNSWSPTWGEHGYIRLQRSSTVDCGIDLNPQDGDGCAGGPSTVKVCGTCGILYDSVYPNVTSAPPL